VSEPQLPEPPPGPATQPQPVPPQQRPPAGAPVSGPPTGELVHYPPHKRALLPTREPKRRKLPLRTIAIIVGGVLAVLCLGGVGTGYLLYRNASEPDRRSPTVTVRQYVTATFDDRDESRAALFTCQKPAVQDVRNLQSDLKSREDRFGITITVSIAAPRESISGKSATVQTDVRIDVPEADGSSSRSSQRWTFSLRDQDGWRVCSAEREPD
jgi:hypothetical protein